MRRERINPPPLQRKPDPASRIAQAVAARYNRLLARAVRAPIDHFDKLRPLDHFDKLRFYLPEEPSAALRAFLRQHSRGSEPEVKKLRCRNSTRCIRGIAYTRELVIYAPDQLALRAIANQPNWHLVYAEIARDICFAKSKLASRLPGFPRIVAAPEDRADPHAMQQLHDEFFVHGTRRRLKIVTSRKGVALLDEEREARRLDGLHTTYTGKRTDALTYSWYAWSLSKLTGEPCFHFEARNLGAEQLARVGIHCAADLCTFDFAAFWDEHYVLAVPDRAAFVAHRHRRAVIRHELHHHPDAVDALIERFCINRTRAHRFRSVQSFVNQCGSLAVVRRIPVVHGLTRDHGPQSVHDVPFKAA